MTVGTFGAQVLVGDDPITSKRNATNTGFIVTNPEGNPDPHLPGEDVIVKVGGTVDLAEDMGAGS